MTDCRCGHPAMLHACHFVHGYQYCEVVGCDCARYTERKRP